MTSTHTRASPDQLLPLSEICAALDEAGLPKPRGGYRAIQVAAASAWFPAVKRNTRWYVRRVDLESVAAAFAAPSKMEGAQ